MLKYLIVQLDDTSVSFCHYNNDKTKPRLIDIDVLKKALFWSMKENLTVQFLYPEHEIPLEYKTLISDIDHVDIVPSSCKDEEIQESADVVIFDSWVSVESYSFSENQVYVIRTKMSDLVVNEVCLSLILPNISRLNLVLTDIEILDCKMEDRYSKFLGNLNEKIFQEYKNNHGVQVNVVTDRMMLDSMNNCGAGNETITLCPDGKFYICPGFYSDGYNDVGDVTSGLNLKNPQLYKLEYAPICRICDSWHCKRCVWQNKRATLEVNTPSHEQCVISHIERNASRKLLALIREIGQFLPEKEIPVISYLDPFDKIQENK